MYAVTGNKTYLMGTVVALIVIISLRVLSLSPGRRSRPPRRRRGSATSIMVVLGSGGHTAEMLQMLREINPSDYSHRRYLVSSGDELSAAKARDFEQTLRRKSLPRQAFGTHGEVGSTTTAAGGAGTGDTRSYSIVTVPRARMVHQPLISTPITALFCLFACLNVLKPSERGHTQFPNLILVNGPGTAVVVVLAAFLLRFFSYRGANQPGTLRVLYVESWARVKTLSLSGRLLLHVADRFIVQWDYLRDSIPGTEYRICVT